MSTETPTPATDFTLGQHVSFNARLVRVWKDNDDDRRKPNKVWKVITCPEGPREGIIIGARTLTDGTTRLGSYDEPTTYTPTRYYTAYMVTTRLRARPVYVLPENLTPADPR